MAAMTLDMSKLKAFNVTDAKPEMQAEILVNKHVIPDFMVDVGEILSTNKPAAAGSLFGNRFNLLGILQCYCMIHHHCALDMSLSNIYLKWDGKKLLFYFESPRLNYAGQEDRAQWREDVFKRLITETFLPVYKAVSEETRCPTATIWSNLSHALQNRFNQWSESMDDPLIRRQAKEDVDFLIKKADPSWFEKKKNPLNKNFNSIEHALQDGQSVLQRKNCCLAYCIDGKEKLKRAERYCYTCPNLTHEERSERRITLREKQKK